jgi:hypothetical protein
MSSSGSMLPHGSSSPFLETPALFDRSFQRTAALMHLTVDHAFLFAGTDSLSVTTRNHAVQMGDRTEGFYDG